MAARSCRGCGAAARGLARLTDGLAPGRRRGAVVVNGRATPLPRSLPPRRAVRRRPGRPVRRAVRVPAAVDWAPGSARRAPGGRVERRSHALSQPGDGDRKARTSPPASCLKVGVLDYWSACGRASSGRAVALPDPAAQAREARPGLPATLTWGCSLRPRPPGPPTCPHRGVACRSVSGPHRETELFMPFRAPKLPSPRQV